MIARKDYQRAIEELRKADHVVLTTHVKPDGDAMGSIAALRRWLLAEGKQVEIIVPTPPPARYAFLDPDGTVQVAGRDADSAAADPPDLVCLVDTGAWQQLAGVESLVKGARRVLVIDHHRTQDVPAQVALVDAEAPATAVLVHDFLVEAGAAIDAETATYLFAGLAMDTDWFRLPTSGAETLRLAARLVEAGAKPHLLYEQLYWNNDLAKMRLLGLAVGGLRPALGGQVMVMRLTQAMFHQTATDADDTENLINECMKVRGVQVGILLTDSGNGHVRVSLRSRPGTDVLGVATRFGGGGHRYAAGARVPGSLDTVEAQILAAVGQALDRSEKPEKA
ncbi:MAG: bifunctional oligoribonuclease/PAP phosphatase NrnA [Planctomycetota bacterium]|nr:bifunctional oligoribonuclease/PAP phosphatase NrnA [Planctomycetota bacterium]